MKRAILCSWVLALAIALAGCAGVKSSVLAGYDFGQVNRVAVADVQVARGEELVQDQIASYFTTELLKKGYQVVERSKVRNLLEEQEFQLGDITTSEGAAKAGRILNVDAVVLVIVPELGEQITITAEMVDVEDGTVIWSGSDTGSTGRTLATIGGAALGAGAGAMAGGDRSGQVIGAVVGGVAGGVLGQALTPAQARKAQKIVVRICKGLPARSASP